MPEKIDRPLKNALDETRLLILGVQILLGFEFQCVFQDGFGGLGRGAKHLSVGSLGLIVLSTAILIAPSMQHRLIEAGQSTPRLIRTTNRLTGWALLPLTIGLALSAYVVTQRTFGRRLDLPLRPSWAALRLFAGSVSRISSSVAIRKRDKCSLRTPLKTKIEQPLTDARVIIPGGQALFGFQFIAMLTSGVDRLPESAKIVHTVALCLVGMNVIILMIPAALHRLSFGGEDPLSDGWAGVSCGRDIRGDLRGFPQGSK